MNKSLYRESTGEGLKLVKEKYDLPLEVQKLILQICWAQHDAQWFLKSKKKLGVAQGNEFNQEVVFSMGKIEARHVIDALNIPRESIKSIPQIFKVMNTFMDVLFPPVMKFKFAVLSEKEGAGIVEKCFVWEEVKKSKGESEYVCACNARHVGWLTAIGVDGRIERIKFIPDGDDVCEFRFILEQD